MSITEIFEIIYFIFFVLLLVFAGERTAEFSLEPKSTQFNRLALTIALGATVLVQVTAVVLGVIALLRTSKGTRGRGFALPAVFAGSLGFLFIAVLYVIFLSISARFAPDDGETLLTRQMEVYDGAVPSGNSVAMLNLLRLGRLTGRTELENTAAAVGRAFSAEAAKAPANHAMLMVAVDFAVGADVDPERRGRPTPVDRGESAPDSATTARPGRHLPGPWHRDSFPLTPSYP